MNNYIICKDNNNKESISLYKSIDAKVFDLKEDLSEKIHVLPKFIVFTFEEVNLENDLKMNEYKITKNSEINFSISVNIFDEDGADHLLIMDYDDKVEDLKKKICNYINVSDVKIFCGKVCESKISLRTYLKDENCVFYSFLKLLVNIINQDGCTSEIEVYRSDLIAEIKKMFFKDNEILMIDNNILSDASHLFKYKMMSPFNILIGFIIYVNHQNQNFHKITVNFNTNISYIKQICSEHYGFDQDGICLMFKTIILENQETVGFYKVRENDEIMINIKIIIKYNEKELIKNITKYDQVIMDLKENLSKEYNFEIDKMILLLNNKELDNKFPINSLKFGEYIVLKIMADQNNTNEIKFMEEFENKLCIEIDSHVTNEGEIIQAVLNIESLEDSLENDKDDSRILNLQGHKNNNIMSSKKICEYTELEMIRDQNHTDDIDGLEMSKNNEIDCLIKNEESIQDMFNIESLKESLDNVHKITIGQRDIRTQNKTISLMIINLESDDVNYYFPRIEVEPNCSIQSLKSSIFCKLHIDTSKLDVYYVGDIFSGGTIDEHMITDNRCIILKARKHKIQMELFIIKIKNEKNQNETRYMIDVFQTVKDLKLILRGQYNVNINQINLSYEGEKLRNKDVIRQLDIENGCLFTLFIEEDEKSKPSIINIKVRNSLRDNYEEDFQIISASTNIQAKELKDNIENIFNLSSVKFVISFNGEILKNENKLSIYNIKDEDEIIISESLLIRYFTGADHFSARVNRYVFIKKDKVSDLKIKINKLLNIEPKFISLTFNSCALEDDETLISYEIENESNIMMISTLAGGTFYSVFKFILFGF